MTSEEKLRVLVDGEWYDASPGFIETVRQIDEGLKRGMTAEEQLKELYRENQKTFDYLHALPTLAWDGTHPKLKTSYEGGAYIAPEHIDLIANLVVERLRDGKNYM